MTVLINGKRKVIDSKFSIIDIVESFKVKKKYLAVGLNGEFVPKQLYSEIKLKEGDQIEIVSPHPGG
jgi:thiamine biosynthesis protein ThiS